MSFQIDPNTGDMIWVSDGPPNYTGGSTGNTGVTGGNGPGGMSGQYPGSDNDPHGVNYVNWLRSKQGLPPLSAEQQGWPTSPSMPGAPTSPNTGVTGGLPPGGVPGATPGATGGSITMQQFNDAWMGSPYPGTVQGLKDFYAAHPEYAAAGITLGGSKGDKIYGPQGVYWGDAVISAGLGGRGKSALSGDPGGGGTAGATGGSGGVIPDNLLSPYGTPYSMPTQEELMNSPGFKTGLEEGMKGIETGAAARGTLLSGGTLKGLSRYAQDYSQNAYNNLYAQKYGINTGNFNIFGYNQSAPFSKLSDLTKLGLPQ